MKYYTQDNQTSKNIQSSTNTKTQKFMNPLLPIKQWLQSRTSAKKRQQNNKNFSPEDISEKEQIKGTPFWINRTADGWFLTLKGYKLTPFHKTRKAAIEEMWLENNGWNIMANMIIIIHEQVANEVAAKMYERGNLKTTEPPKTTEIINNHIQQAK